MHLNQLQRTKIPDMDSMLMLKSIRCARLGSDSAWYWQRVDYVPVSDPPNQSPAKHNRVEDRRAGEGSMMAVGGVGEQLHGGSGWVGRGSRRAGGGSRRAGGEI